MTRMTRSEAHVILAGIRVLSHLKELPPTPDQLAELLEMPPTLVRLQLTFLSGMGAVALVESAYETHVEIREYPVVEELDEQEGPGIDEDLRAFESKKKAETEKMAHLFDSGEHHKQRQEKLEQMDQDLEDFRNRKPKNPFGDD